MSRLPRVFADNAVYHILQRGNNKRILFFSDDDHKYFLQLIGRYKRKYPIELYHYCLMPNHIHLLLKIISKEHLPKFFQGLFQSFQFHHRKKYGYCGSLYQNRYKSLLINSDAYLLECGRYIERNPLRAKLVSSLNEYPWSSYRFYSEGVPNKLITPCPAYLSLAKTCKKRQKIYKEYVSQARPYEMLLDEKMAKLK
ncbi:MAG: transposase [Candidatus Omnitrophota bacterium]